MKRKKKNILLFLSMSFFLFFHHYEKRRKRGDAETEKRQAEGPRRDAENRTSEIYARYAVSIFLLFRDIKRKNKILIRIPRNAFFIKTMAYADKFSIDRSIARSYSPMLNSLIVSIVPQLDESLHHYMLISLLRVI